MSARPPYIWKEEEKDVVSILECWTFEKIKGVLFEAIIAFFGLMSLAILFLLFPAILFFKDPLEKRSAVLVDTIHRVYYSVLAILFLLLVTKIN